jgi:hypothetical protein
MDINVNLGPRYEDPFHTPTEHRANEPALIDCKDWDTFFSKKTAAHIAEGAAIGAGTIGWIPGVTFVGGAFVGAVGALSTTWACKNLENTGHVLPALNINVHLE